jgi:AcrR family transcriptional regulator
MTLETTSLTPSQDATRSAILESSRELFARFGYKKTTMEDIAATMRKGKSSLYYYFKNKEDIFQAVIELESGLYFSRLKEVVHSDRSPSVKLKDYVLTRMELMAELKNFQCVLKEGLYGGYEFLGGVNENAEAVEADFLKSILDEGVISDIFSVKNSKIAAIGIGTALRGLEIPIFRGFETPVLFHEEIDNILSILFYGVMKR